MLTPNRLPIGRSGLLSSSSSRQECDAGLIRATEEHVRPQYSALNTIPKVQAVKQWQPRHFLRVNQLKLAVYERVGAASDLRFFSAP
jgi:hypothetical protein